MENRLLFAMFVFIGLLHFSFADGENNGTAEMEEDTSEERKKDDGMRQMFMMVMMLKSIVQTVVSIITPFIQIKGLIISSIMVLVNVARLVMSIKQQHGQEPLKMPWAASRRYAPLPPPSSHAPHIQAIYLPNTSDDRKM